MKRKKLTASMIALVMSVSLPMTPMPPTGIWKMAALR